MGGVLGGVLGSLLILIVAILVVKRRRRPITEGNSESGKESPMIKLLALPSAEKSLGERTRPNSIRTEGEIASYPGFFTGRLTKILQRSMRVRRSSDGSEKMISQRSVRE